MAWPEFIEVDIQDPEFKLGMIFANVTDVRAVVREHAIQNARKIFFAKNLSNNIQEKCEEPCAWYFYASKLQKEDIFQITRLQPEHTCSRQRKNYVINSN